MKHRIELLAGAAAGAVASAVAVNEHRSRRAAERFGAAALETLLRAIDANDHETGRHVRRVAAYALVIAHAADLSEHDCRTVERVALFHDIGKIHEALFDIIHDPDRLSAADRRSIARHPELGAEVLAPLLPFYPQVPPGVLAHHERWDGRGYPRGLAGRQIPIFARVVSIADTFDAVTHDRRYRQGRSATDARRVLLAGRGTQFDPELIDLTLLPPVFEQLMHARRALLLPQPRRAERRHGTHEEQHAPDVIFRWRLGSDGRVPAGGVSR